MHKRCLFFAFGAALLLSPLQTGAEEPVFPLGERLAYKITWLGIPVGTGEVWAKEKTELNGRAVFHIVGKVQTNRVLRKIFPMRDEIHSWIDAETLEALQFEKQIDELFINTHEKFVFDGAKKTGHFENLRTQKKNDFKIQSPVHDFISVFYWARRQDLTQTAKMTLTCDQKDWVLTLIPQGKETIKHAGKKISTLRIEPVSFVDGVEKRGRAWINLTDDASKKPVRISYRAPFGSVTGTLLEQK